MMKLFQINHYSVHCEMVVLYIDMSSTTHLPKILKLGFAEQIPYSRTSVELPRLQPTIQYKLLVECKGIEQECFEA